jgi:predicted DNA-binding transcriptional regulator YafY
MAEQKMKSMLVRQWRLLQFLRSSNQSKSIKSLMDELKVNQATIDRDLSILEEAGLPLARLEHSGEMRWTPSLGPVSRPRYLHPSRR